MHDLQPGTPPEFQRFSKIHRLYRGVTITEKIDGTNGVVHVSEDGVVRAGSRERWLDPDVKGGDNFGFGAWVREHADELRLLGPGYHYGEWWGLGIQRGYCLPEKRWSLFNTARWGDDRNLVKYPEPRPSCCSVVPVVARLPGFDSHEIALVADALKKNGSMAMPGYMYPEGIVVHHEHAGWLAKFTFDGDGTKSTRGRRLG